jgi:transcriptional regulator with XRE-family HTH domain
MKQTLGQKIRELRESKDLSLREFAKRLQTSAAHISDIELGRRYPSEQLLTRMAKTLGTDFDELDRFDFRPPVEDIKRMSEANPAYGFAFRRLLEADITAEEILAMLEKRKERPS